VRRSLRFVIAALAAVAAGACSHLPDVGDVMSGARGEAATPDLSPRERVRLAIELLGQGEEERAKSELEAALAAAPDLSTAQRLLAQINGDPQQLLRGEARAYTVRQGETMSVLAERFQGDGLLFYALARFNGLDAPDQLAEGQTLMIPRRPGVRMSAEIPPPSPPSASAPSALALRGLDPAHANQLRLRALQHMNSGQLDRAVALLRQAQTLDAENPAIQHDLDRAVRLQASLRSSGGAAN
jgi:tetratricopeptide (TPR) repeat protein